MDKFSSSVSSGNFFVICISGWEYSIFSIYYINLISSFSILGVTLDGKVNDGHKKPSSRIYLIAQFHSFGVS